MTTDEQSVDYALRCLDQALVDAERVRFGLQRGKDAVRVDLKFMLSDLCVLVQKIERVYPDCNSCSVGVEIADAIHTKASNAIAKKKAVVRPSNQIESTVLYGPKEACDWLLERIDAQKVNRDLFLEEEQASLSPREIADQDEIITIASSVTDARFLEEWGPNGIKDEGPKRACIIHRQMERVMLRKRYFVAPLVLPPEPERERVCNELSDNLLLYLRATFLRQLLSATTLIYMNNNETED